MSNPPVRPPLVVDDDLDLRLDLGTFQPVARALAPQAQAALPPAPPAEVIRSVADASGFHSRHPARPTLRQGQRTGRTVLLGARISPEAAARYHEIVEEEAARFMRREISHRVTLGEVVEMALAALERERASRKD